MHARFTLLYYAGYIRPKENVSAPVFPLLTAGSAGHTRDHQEDEDLTVSLAHPLEKSQSHDGHARDGAMRARRDICTALSRSRRVSRCKIYPTTWGPRRGFVQEEFRIMTSGEHCSRRGARTPVARAEIARRRGDRIALSPVSFERRSYSRKRVFSYLGRNPSGITPDEFSEGRCAKRDL